MHSVYLALLINCKPYEVDDIVLILPLSLQSWVAHQRAHSYPQGCDAIYHMPPCDEALYSKNSSSPAHLISQYQRLLELSRNLGHIESNHGFQRTKLKFKEGCVAKVTGSVSETVHEKS